MNPVSVAYLASLLPSSVDPSRTAWDIVHCRPSLLSHNLPSHSIFTGKMLLLTVRYSFTFQFLLPPASRQIYQSILIFTFIYMFRKTARRWLNLVDTFQTGKFDGCLKLCETMEVGVQLDAQVICIILMQTSLGQRNQTETGEEKEYIWFKKPLAWK